ncbi:MAG: hypothetical protein KA244_07620 [Deltaproteobacteria bacterium]|jgi:hypothetical protein|nr:hypothetical protein [Deltaproteobacteria bacterium]
MTSPQAQWQQAGNQLYRIEDDTQWLRIQGIVEESELRTITESGREIARQRGYYIVLCDATHGTGMSPQARQYNAGFNKANQGLHGVSVVYGVSSTARVMLNLVFRGMTLLALRPPAVIFAKDEAEALLIAQTERLRLQALSHASSQPQK